MKNYKDKISLFIQQQRDSRWAVWVGEKDSRPPGYSNRYEDEITALGAASHISGRIATPFAVEELPSMNTIAV